MDNNARITAYNTLEGVKHDPLFLRTLTFTVVFGTHLQAKTRKIGAATLKGVIDSSYHTLDTDTRAYVQQCVPRLLIESEDVDLSRLATNVISTIVRNAGMEAWPELPGILIQGLTSMLSAGTHPGLRSWLLLTSQITTDNPQELDDVALGTPINELYPLLIHALALPDKGCAILALESLTNVQYCHAAALAKHKQDFLSVCMPSWHAPQPCNSNISTIPCRHWVVLCLTPVLRCDVLCLNVCPL